MPDAAIINVSRPAPHTTRVEVDGVPLCLKPGVNIVSAETLAALKADKVFMSWKREGWLSIDESGDPNALWLASLTEEQRKGVEEAGQEARDADAKKAGTGEAAYARGLKKRGIPLPASMTAPTE